MICMNCNLCASYIRFKCSRSTIPVNPHKSAMGKTEIVAVVLYGKKRIYKFFFWYIRPWK